MLQFDPSWHSSMGASYKAVLRNRKPICRARREKEINLPSLLFLGFSTQFTACLCTDKVSSCVDFDCQLSMISLKNERVTLLEIGMYIDVFIEK